MVVPENLESASVAKESTVFVMVMKERKNCRCKSYFLLVAVVTMTSFMASPVPVDFSGLKELLRVIFKLPGLISAPLIRMS